MTSKDTVRGLRYAGANWLERQGHELSDLGHLVANIIGQAVLGIYHMDERDIRATDWADEHVIRVRWRSSGGELASYDGSELTRLLVLATDAGLRLAIQPRSMWTVDVQFTRRDVNSPSKMDGLPSLEAMVTSIRFQLGEPIGLGARSGSKQAEDAGEVSP